MFFIHLVGDVIILINNGKLYFVKIRRLNSGFPAARSRVVIRLAEITKAKPNANTRTLRPDECLVVSKLSAALPPTATATLPPIPPPPARAWAVPIQCSPIRGVKLNLQFY
jgi:hypothetical protein